MGEPRPRPARRSDLPVEESTRGPRTAGPRALARASTGTPRFRSGTLRSCFERDRPASLPLRSFVVVLGVTGAGRDAAAQSTLTIDGRSGVYSDSDATLVSTSTVAVRANPTERFGVKGRYLADIITSASVDVVSAATGRWDETRHEIEGGLSYQDGTRTAGASYIYSVENDWESHTFSGGLSHDWSDHTVTVGVAGSLVKNHVGRAEDENFARDLTVASGSVYLTYVATKHDLLSATYSLSYAFGYQSSPYRFVHFDDPDVPGRTLGHEEKHPDRRARHALGLRWNHHAFRDTVIRSQLRLYGDSWGVLSVTLALEYVIGLGDFEVGLIGRGYAQGHARFYEDEYESSRRYMTADRELSTFYDAFGGARFGWRHEFGGFLEELRAELKGEAFVFYFPEFLRMTERTGLIAELALGASF